MSGASMGPHGACAFFIGPAGGGRETRPCARCGVAWAPHIAAMIGGKPPAAARSDIHDLLDGLPT